MAAPVAEVDDTAHKNTVGEKILTTDHVFGQVSFIKVMQAETS